jgi:NADH-quinone oxidoreductase subunit K
MAILNLYNFLGTYLVIGAMLFGFGVYGLVARKTVRSPPSLSWSAHL